MAEYTNRLGLVCPAPEDHYNVADFNENMKKLEELAAALEDSQRRQDYEIRAIQEQLDTGFTGHAVTFGFADLEGWQGYDGSGLPEGVWDAADSRLYV